ncbi:MAG: hypothetical protein ACI965_001520, partial [Paraglaciecola sp.]
FANGKNQPDLAKDGTSKTTYLVEIKHKELRIPA